MTTFEFASAAIIAAACAAAAIACFALNRRIQRLASTERGIGKAVSEMSVAVSRFEALLATAEKSSREASAILEEQLEQARWLVGRLDPDAASKRSAAALRETCGKLAAEDPLADVVPKTGSSTATRGRRNEREAAPSSIAERRLADLRLRLSKPDLNETTGLRRARA